MRMKLLSKKKTWRACYSRLWQERLLLSINLMWSQPFVGLGLMEVPFESLPLQARSNLVQKVDDHLESMNIFKLHNVLWGMARGGLTVDSPEFSYHTSTRLLRKDCWRISHIYEEAIRGRDVGSRQHGILLQ